MFDASIFKGGADLRQVGGELREHQHLQAGVDAFNKDDTPVFLISMKAGGTGLNLTGASFVILTDPWWNAAVQEQASDRAHRIGQTRKVNVVKVVAKDTIEERIVALQESKRELASSLIEGNSGKLASLTTDELIDLFM